MTLPCPVCSAAAPAGASFCSACGGSLLVAWEPGGTGAPCALHPAVQFVHACSRCGAFCCPACLAPESDREPVCRACEERAPTGSLPWDRRAELGTLVAFWRTAVAAMLRPRATFDRAPPDAS